MCNTHNVIGKIILSHFEVNMRKFLGSCTERFIHVFFLDARVNNYESSKVFSLDNTSRECETSEMCFKWD